MKKKLFTLLTLMLCVCSGAWAAEETISLVSYTVSDGVATISSESGNATVTLSRNGGNVDGPASNSRGLRWQKTRVISVSVSTGYKINSVKLTSNSNGNSLGDIQYTLTDGSNALSGSWDNAFTSGKKDAYTWTATSGTAYSNWVLTNSGTSGDIYVASVTVNYETYTPSNTAPTIVTQPTASLDAYVGYEASLTVAATGYPAPSYQWYSNTTASNTGGTAIDGATNATYTFTPTTTGTQYYYAVATNIYDDSEHTATSNVATVSIGLKYKVSYSAGESGSTISIPLGTTDYSAGEIITLPTNHYFYLEGSSVSKWSDGENEFDLGATYTVNSDVTFYPVFAENTKILGDDETSITWTFARNSGAPNYAIEGNGKTTSVIGTTQNGIDVKMDVLLTQKSESENGKFNNGSYLDRAQVNATAKFTIPAVNGMTVKYTTTNGTPKATDEILFGSDKATSVSSNEYIYEYSGSDATLTITDNAGAKYPSGITVIYPEKSNNPLASIAKFKFTAKSDWGTSTGTQTVKNITATFDKSTGADISIQNDFVSFKRSNTLTIAAVDGYAIEKIVIGFVSGYTPKENTVEASVGLMSADGTTWTGAAKTVVLTNSATGSNDSRVNALSVTYVPAEQVTLAASGTSSFSSSKALDFSAVEGLTAYAVTDVTSTAVTLTSVEAAPASTGLVVKGTGSTAYNIPVAATTPADITVNKLVATVERTQVGANNAWVLNGGEFKLYTGEYVPAGKAYLPATEVPAAGSARLQMVFDGEATGISTAVNEVLSDGRFFDLQGRQVAQPTKGLYIVNGKKVIVK